MNLKDIRTIVRNGLSSSRLITSNYDSTIEIIETQNKAQELLKKVTINNVPITDLWIFENEESEKVFLSGGYKVEKTLIYIDKDNKKLHIILIELKSTLNADSLKHCGKKFRDSISYISIYLSLNEHDENEFEDFTLNPVGLICYNKEDINSESSTASSYIIQSYLTSKEENKDVFSTDLSTDLLGRIVIPVISKKNSIENSSEFSIDFIKDIKPLI